MAEKYDGYLAFNTKVDTKGFDKGIEAVQVASAVIKRLSGEEVLWIIQSRVHFKTGRQTDLGLVNKALRVLEGE